MKIEECDNFDACEAPLCPLDKNVLRSKHLEGEAICFYIREHVKGNKDNSELHSIIGYKLPYISTLGGYSFRKALERVKKSPSKTETKNLVQTGRENVPEGEIQGGHTEKSDISSYQHKVETLFSVEPQENSIKQTQQSYRTLTLEEAASFLKIHKETLRQKALSGEIPGAKIGRAWVFLESDLVSAIRKHYSNNWCAIQEQPNIKEVSTWPCIDEVKMARGGSTLQFREDKEYEQLLEPKIKHLLNSFMMNCKLDYGKYISSEKFLTMSGKMLLNNGSQIRKEKIH